MSQHLADTTTRLDSVAGTNIEPACWLIGGVDGDLQVAVSPGSQTVMFDVQASRQHGVDGRVRNDHAAVRLSYDDIAELRALLDRIGEPAEPRQPALWSPATFTSPIAPPRHRAKRRAGA